jgi:ArsR family transcriptional regulator, lead/cadmium/zinc/bismuth-responsive transcriptional repressor
MKYIERRVRMTQDNKTVVCDCEVIHAEVVESVRSHMPQEELLYDLADFFKMFGDSTRLKLLWALDREEMCVCDLAVLLNMTKSAVSHQLKTLRQQKLVKYRKEGKTVFYSLQDEHVKNILEIGLEHIEER